jgi:hypothetical protein
MWCWIRMEKISWTDRWKNEDAWQRVNPASYIMQTVKIRRASWIGHIVHSSWLLKHATEGKIEVMRRRGSRSKRLVDDLKERRRYSKLKGEALDRTLRRTRFGRDCALSYDRLQNDDGVEHMRYIKCNRNISSYVTGYPWMWPYTGCDGRTCNSRMWDHF